MKRGLFLTFAFCLLASLGSVTAQAQDGIGLQTYITSVGEFKGPLIGVGGFGAGLGMKVAPQVVISFNAYVAPPPVLVTYSNGSVGTGFSPAYNPPFEFGCGSAYVFNDSDPSFYVFAGYSHVPQGGMSAGINLIHVGLGLAPKASVSMCIPN